MNPYDATDTPAAPQSGQVLTIQKLDPLSVGRVLAGVYGGLAVFFSAGFIVVGGLGALGAAVQGGVGAAEIVGGLGGGLLLAVFVPVFYAGFAFVMGALLGLLYNLSARWFGGISFTLG